MTINAVIFDIGNVLIEWQPERFFDVKIGEARRREMFLAIALHGINDEVHRGGGPGMTSLMAATGASKDALPTRWREAKRSAGPILDQDMPLIHI